MEYTIVSSLNVTGSNVVVLKNNVNELLEEGWKLYGSPFLDKDGDICQALIKD